MLDKKARDANDAAGIPAELGSSLVEGLLYGFLLFGF